MVGCNSYRNPSVLAKITSTIDVISGGRLDWGIGAGWYENEYQGYGFEFPQAEGPHRDAAGERRDRAQSMWTEPETTYDGKYYKLVARQLRPEAAAAAHPPIWIGGGGEQLTLRVVAPLRRLQQLRWQAGGVGAQARGPEGSLRGGRARRRRDRQDLVARGVHPRDRGRDRGGGSA